MPDSDRSPVARLGFAVRFVAWWVWRYVTLRDVRAADSLEELSDVGQLRATLLPFDGQRWYHQVVIVAVGVGVWVGIYAGVMSWMGWAPYASLDTAEALQYRRHAAAGALAATVTYYALLWTQAFGGPVLNLFWYPMVTVVAMPRTVLGLFWGAPERRFAAGGIVEAPAQWSVDVLSMLLVGWLPFFLIGVAMMAYWSYAGERGRRHRIAWHRRNPDLLLRADPSGGWAELDDDIQEVYLEAGYDPGEAGDRSPSDTNEQDADER